MESIDIRDAVTPLSLGVNGAQRKPRALWKKPFVKSSTPIAGVTNKPIFHLCLEIEKNSLLLDRRAYEPSESPIFFAYQPRIGLADGPIFGRKLSLESNRLSTSGVATTLEKMELSEDENQNVIVDNDNVQKYNNEFTIEEKDHGDNSSGTHSNEFKKVLNKKKKKKSSTPKNKSPKVYKVGAGRKITGPGGAAKKVSPGKPKVLVKTAKKLTNSPKSGKLVSSQKVSSTQLPTAKKSESTTIDKNSKAGTSQQTLLKKSSTCNGSQGSRLRCARSPKLQTAARALVKKHREEIRQEKEKEMEALRLKQLEEQRRREEEEIARLRQQTVFKAQPIRKYAPLPRVKKRAITDPISPNVAKRRRIESSTNSCNSKHA